MWRHWLFNQSHAILGDSSGQINKYLPIFCSTHIQHLTQTCQLFSIGVSQPSDEGRRHSHAAVAQSEETAISIIIKRSLVP